MTPDVEIASASARINALAQYFALNPLSANWFAIRDPNEVLSGPLVVLDAVRPRVAGRSELKKLFRGFGIVVNEEDGSEVLFPAASAGKMLYQSGIDISSVAPAFKTLFEKSVRAWNEREVPMEGHKFHFNVQSYRNYVCRFLMDGGAYFVRFTVREIGMESAVHASTISAVSVYEKTEGALADSHPENPEDGNKTPFIDNKISFFLSAVKGVNLVNLKEG